MPGSLHEAYVRMLKIQAGVQTGGFRKALRKEFCKCGPDHTKWSYGTDEDPDSGCQHIPLCDQAISEALLRNRVVPDAYQIDRERLIVRAFEVDITSALDDRKVEAYSELWWAFDAGEWTFELVCIDRYGKAHSVAIGDLAFALLFNEQDECVADPRRIT